MCSCLLFAGQGFAQQAALDASRLPPKSPQESLRCIQVRAGFRVELMLAEPLVADPIAIAWGPDASLWVVEMGDYPSGHEQLGNTGQIRRVQDTDGDGQYDTSTVFLDGLGFPTGVFPWREGALVACAPDILYAVDTDQDGRADRTEVLFTGFAEGNPQHRLNGLRWGLDSWIHCANGDSGGNITSIKTGQQTEIHGHDFRIHPDRGQLELLTGMSQFGRCRDDWGNWFGGNSDWPFWHSVLPDRYLRRNPYLKPPDPRVHLMSPPANSPVFPISRGGPQIHERTATNVITSACGAGVYRDELFGPGFSQSYFVCEPEHNLVHHEVMHRCGVSYASQRPAEERNAEFLASRDNWFRPTQARTGPDGALWIVDMYRLVIEHPEWIRSELQGKLDLRAGAGKGRIYRVSPADRPPRPVMRLDRLQTPQLVAAIDSPNGPQRDLAQQLLVERRESESIGRLEQLVCHSQRAACRLTALCTLDGMEAIRTEILERALRDSHPAVRRQAIRICEPLLDREPDLQEAVLGCLDDADMQVRLQLALSLGQWQAPRAGRALSRLAAEHATDRFMVAAVMSSATRHSAELLAGLLDERHVGRPQAALVNDLLRMAHDTDQEGLLASGLKRVARAAGGSYHDWQFEVLAGLLDDLDYRGIGLEQLRRVAGPELNSAIDTLPDVFRTARHTVSDTQAPLPRRVRAARLLGRGVDEHDADIRRLANLLSAQMPGELQQAAVKTLGNFDRTDIPGILLDDWPTHGPELQMRILDVLLNRADWTLELLGLFEARQLSVTALSAAHRSKLVLHPRADVRQRMGRLLNLTLDTARQQVVQRYEKALQLDGDPRRGEVLFQQHCAVCHRLRGKGHDVGPDLRALTDRSPQALLVALLDPNRQVEPRYQAYSAVTVDGRIFTGILSGESGHSITLTGPQQERRVLLRAELQQVQATGRSLMPDGLETLLTEPQEFADLILHLRAALEAGP